MAKSEDEQIRQLEGRINSLDTTVKQLSDDFETFNKKLSNVNTSNVNQLKSEYESLQKRVEGLGKSQERTAKSVDEQIQKVSRSRRADIKIQERQTKLLEAQQRLASTGDLGQRFSLLRNSLGSIDFNTILATANEKAIGNKTLSEESTKRFKKAQQDCKKEVDKTTNSIKQQESALRKFQGAASNLATTFASLFGLNQIRRFASEVVKVRGEFEMTEVALRNIIGSEVKSQQIWKKTLALAVNSPFTAQQLLQSTKQLAAFRIETSKLYDTTKMLADVSIGLGVDVQRLILAYGHTKASGFLRGMYARQFATAGVNIYGELADYYTKLEGKLVSFKDVYERISKKLVTFADVEAVFEKITSKGGQFYNMQEILSNTVQGQINKIKDTWQQAMNDIGKSQTGLIRGVVGAILGIIKNWRTWLSVIEATTAAVIIFKGVQLASVMLGVAAATDTAGRATNALSRGLKRSAAAIAANPFALAAAAIAALAIGIGTAVKHMKDFNKSIDENNLTLYNARQSILNYEERLQANNQIIEDYKNGAIKGEEAQKALSKAQSENASIVAELKSKYPEYTENLEQNKDGIVKLTEELQAYNQELQIQIALQNKFKQGNLFNQGLGQDSDQFFARLEKDVLKVQSKIGEFKMQLANLGVDERELPSSVRDILNIDFSNPEKALQEYNDKLKKAKDDFQKSYQKIWNQKYEEVFNRPFEPKFPKTYRELKVAEQNYYRIERLVHNSEEYADLVHTFGDSFDYLSREIDIAAHAYEEFDREFQQGNKFENGVQTEFSLAQTMVRTTANELLAEIENLPEKERDAYNELIKQEGNIYAVMLNHHAKIEEDIRNGLIHANDATRNTLIEQGKATNKSRQNVLNERLAIELAYLAAEQKLQATAQQLAAEESKKESRQDKDYIATLKTELSNAVKEYQGVFDWFTEQTSKTNQGHEGENDKGKKSASRLISLIREMRAEYDKLSKSAYGYAKSEATVRESYKQSVKEILGKAGITDYDFTTNAGMIAALEKVKAYAKKLGPEAAAEVEKYIGQLNTEMTINLQVRIREDFGRQMEEAFGNYELTLDLQKLNLPSDVLSDLFDLEAVDLSDLRRRVTTFYNELAKGGDIDRDDMKSIEGYIKKIDDMERKQQRERIKDYAKYLEYELSERAKISMEYARKIAQVQIERFSDDEEENLRRRQKIIEGLNKEKDEKLAKQDWEDFKGMEVYVQMMEDLEKHGTVALRTMREELEKIRKNAKNLSPRALKEVVSAIEKIREIELNRSDPFKGIVSAREEVKKALSEAGVSSKAELYASADAAEKELVSVQKEKQDVDRIVAAKKRQKELQEEIAKLSSEREIADVLYNPDTEDETAALTDLMNKKQEEANNIAEERRNLEKEILELAKEQSRLINEEGQEGITDARREEIATRKGEIANRIKEITQLVDAKTIGENIAKGIFDEIYRYIQANGELNGLSPQDLSDSRGEKEQQELSEYEKELQKIQQEYDKAINEIDLYNKQVARLMVFIETWTSKVQELWSGISELSSAYEGEFGEWVSRWGGVVDTTLQQVSKLSKAFADFQAVRADYLKSAIKKAADKSTAALDNAEKANDTIQTQANTAATQANTLAKHENAIASNLVATGNAAVGTSAAAATPAVATFGATLLMAMGWVGLIMAALEALFAIIKAIAGAHDAELDKKIENQQKKIDALTDAYARLEKQIEKTWDSVSYMQTYEQQVQNIREQIDAMEAQMAAERAKKNTDDNAVRQYQQDIQDAYDQLDELEQKSIEVFGGIGEEGYRSAAEGFVDAWKSAFLETGDGLQGLQDHFDEFLQDWFVKQATMRIAGGMLAPVFRQIDAAVDKYGEGGTSAMLAEIENVRDMAAAIFPDLSLALEDLAGMFGVGGEGSLSGLAAGIQGMTEEQANILEAYWNSVRMYTASIDQNVAMIATALGIGGNNPSSNPMLQQMSLIAANTQATHQLLQSVTKSGHSLGGYGIKVFND